MNIICWSIYVAKFFFVEKYIRMLAFAVIDESCWESMYFPQVEYMMTSSNGNISALLTFCVGNSPVTGEFPSQRPVTRSFGVLFDLHLNKRLSKQSRGWWFETPSHSLWRHYNVKPEYGRYFKWNFVAQNFMKFIPYAPIGNIGSEGVLATTHHLIQCWPCPIEHTLRASYLLCF